ncbi:hemerythrin domain-containing protein [Rubrolithibacter danxiaensis]|uniref:hemerythrin domain-containing protein n=1 Tax=Rubrolithibacter danxiaensis TaxID=3390805 RepID=UPI003BF8DCD1
MKRNVNLLHLSRDHHHGLLLGWKIRQGLKYLTLPETVAEYVDYFSREALFPHFQEEEQTILIYLQADDAFRLRTINEHTQIENAIHALLKSKDKSAAVLIKVADMLDAHIRFEERELFPYIENLLSDEQLEEIGKNLDDNHQPFTDNFSNEFWREHAH